MRKENLFAVLSVGGLTLLPWVAFSRKTKETAKKIKKHCPVTGERTRVVHHIRPTYQGGSDQLSNALPLSSVGHAIVHAKRAYRALKQGMPSEVIRNELDAAHAPLGQMTFRQRQDFDRRIQAAGINLSEIEARIRPEKQRG
jgi:hypothetical protein